MDVFTDWPEISAFALLVLGSILALTSSGFYFWGIAVVAAALFGHLYGKYRKGTRWPVGLMALGFLTGFLLGTDTSLMIYVVLAYGASFGALLYFHLRFA